MKEILICLSAAVLLSGCASFFEYKPYVEKVTILEPDAECGNKMQCEAMWVASRRWVNDHIRWRIKDMADGYLETYGAPAGSIYPSARVTREPVGDDKYRFVLELFCQGSWCGDQLAAEEGFKKYVNAAGSKFEKQQQSDDESEDVSHVKKNKKQKNTKKQ